MHGQEQGKILQATWSMTPFKQQSLLGDFGYLVVGNKGIQVFQGEYIPPPHSNKHDTHLLCFLKMPEGIPDAKSVSTVSTTEGLSKDGNVCTNVHHPAHLGITLVTQRLYVKTVFWQTLKLQLPIYYMHPATPHNDGAKAPTS